MASLDFAYDLLDKLNEEKMDYVVIVIQRGKTVFKANVFENVKDLVGQKVICKALSETEKQISNKKLD